MKRMGADTEYTAERFFMGGKLMILSKCLRGSKMLYGKYYF